jgi:hypothetical protein
MESRTTSPTDRTDDLFDLGATGLLGGFTALLILGALWSSNAFNDLAAPFLLAAFAVVYFGNRRQDDRARRSSTPPVSVSGPPAV